MQITEMDQKCALIAATRSQIAELEDQVDTLKEGIKDIVKEVEEYFIETNREDPYTSPFGTLYVHSDLSVKQPRGEALHALFQHFVKIHGEEAAWQKMSINNQLLKAELKEHISRLEDLGEDPLLSPLPGVEPPTAFKTLRFRKSRK